MIIPSIDLEGGNAVQLVGGERLAIDAGDPRPVAERFGRVGDVAVIDLDAARGIGSNADVIRDLCRRHRCRVGGGIRDVDTARMWLDAGAEKIILGTAAEPALLSQLPKERLIAALDAKDGDVVVEGWTKKTGANVLDRMAELRDHVSGFLVTFVEKEGRMQGTRLDLVEDMVAAAGDARLTIAGGVTTSEDIAALDRLGADAQVGMALYSGRLSLAEGFCAPLVSDRPDGLWPTVVVDEGGRSLGLTYSNLDSIDIALTEGVGCYWSRRRGLWRKGQTSGAKQALVRVDVDCDRDTLRFVVQQDGAGFCHLDQASCFGDKEGLPALESVLWGRKESAPPGSYSKRLFDDDKLLAAKLREEVDELIQADSPADTLHEAADVMFFLLTRLARDGIRFADVERVMDERRKRVSRRPGNAKPQYLATTPEVTS